MHILITGSEGFIGTETIKYLDRILNAEFSITRYDLMLGRDIRDIDQLDAVVAERALVGYVGPRIDETATVGTCVNAVAAAQAAFLGDQYDAGRAFERRSYRADLHTRRVRAVVA